ncbi:MAG: low affinity iron permease family protein [Acidimicrobiales bacterium]
MKLFTRPLVSDGDGHVADSITRETPWFGRLSNAVRNVIGSPKFTALLLGLVVVWLVVGPFVKFSRAWELTATAGAPIGALILLVVLQHTQNRDDMALHLKLDEIIRSSEANNGLISIEDSPEEELSRLLSDYRTHAGHDPQRAEDPAYATRGARPPRRQRRRFAKGDLGPDQSFIFRSPEGGLKVEAQNLLLFTLLAAGVDDDTWLDHLHRGDYSRWFDEVIGDDILTRVASYAEAGEGQSAEDSRRLIIETIAQRYPLSA